MSTADKLNKLIETKEAIRQSIIAKGTDVGEDVPFSQYPSKINEIQSGGGSEYVNPDFYEIRTKGGTDFRGLFGYMTGDNLDLSNLDVSKVTDASYMFSNCNIENLNIGEFNFNNLTSATSFFGDATISGIKGIENLYFPKLKSFSNFFDSFAGPKELNLSNWDISNVNVMTSMFASCEVPILNLSNWDTSNVTNMSYMFNSYTSYLEELIIPDWDMTNTTSHFYFLPTSYLSKLKYIDLSRSNDLTISRIASFLPTRTETTFGDVSIPENSSQTVIDALIAKYWKPVGPKLDLISCEIVAELDEVIIGGSTKIYIKNCNPWYGDVDNNIEFVVVDNTIVSVDDKGVLTSHAIGSTEVYLVLKDTKAVISNTIVINVVESYTKPNEIIFMGLSSPKDSYNYILANDDTILLSSMDSKDLGNGDSIYSYDLGDEALTYISFSGYHSTVDALGNKTCKKIIKFDIDTSNITDMNHMFFDCKYIPEIPNINTDTSNVTDMSNMFRNCDMITSIPELDTSNVTNMNDMFGSCDSLASLDLSNWDTSNVTSMSDMFSGCHLLASLDLSNWDTSNLTSMSGMFRSCYLLASLDLSSFNTAKVYSMGQMFESNKNLINIKGDLDLSSVTSVDGMFSGCFKLEEVSLKNIFKNSRVSNSYTYKISLGYTKVKDECLISIISELPDLINDKGLTDTSNLIFTLPLTNTLTAEQVQPAIDKGWTVANVNAGVINEATTYSLRRTRTENTGKVYKLVENENGNYQSQDGTVYEILEVNNAVSSEGINVGWTPFESLEQAMLEFEVMYVVEELDEEI